MADAKITVPKEGLPKKDDNVVKLDLTKKAQEFKHKRQMIAMLLSKAKKWLKKYGPPKKN